jgi:hypothetical protein
VSQRGYLYIRGEDEGLTWDVSPFSKAPYIFTIGNGMLRNEPVYEKQSEDDDTYHPLFVDGKFDMFVVPQSVDEMVFRFELEVILMDDTRKIETNLFIPEQVYHWLPGRHLHYKITVVRDVARVGAEVIRWDQDPSGNMRLPLD